MGIDLTLHHDGKEVAYLGRAHHFESFRGGLDSNYSSVIEEIGQLREELLLAIIKRDTDNIDHLMDELVQIGELLMLVKILEQNKITYKKE